MLHTLCSASIYSQSHFKIYNLEAILFNMRMAYHCVGIIILPTYDTNITYVLFIETMQAPDFKDFANAMTEYIAGYLENIRDR